MNDASLSIARMYLVHPTEQQKASGAGWNSPWKPRENLGKFIIDVSQNKTYLSKDTLTFEIGKGSTQSFMLTYENMDRLEQINWKHCFLRIDYFSRSGLNFLISPVEKGKKAIENQPIDLSNYSFRQ